MILFIAQISKIQRKNSHFLRNSTVNHHRKAHFSLKTCGQIQDGEIFVGLLLPVGKFVVILPRFFEVSISLTAIRQFGQARFVLVFQCDGRLKEAFLRTNYFNFE
jgi:hypothetical protein